ncbi:MULTISPECIES: ABC transporter ATP-binding protein [unclassified Streptomyces]|uniref:ABC transporter ATP-binding protein n=1 Tax=unclassified Streptomyces TaxID=2593676 RepID=UPI003D8C4974
MDYAIRCAGLTKRYGSRLAVHGLNLTVEPGQVFGFLGPNGSGKTTTMRMLLGLVRPTSGRAWIHGRPLPDPVGLAEIGAMIEEPGFHPWATGRQNLELLALSGPPLRQRDAVLVALDRVGLASDASRRVRAYSQGMRQRLGLAAALLRQPSLLILDEPTNGLDPVGIQEMRTLLGELADAGTTVFLSSHLLSEIEQVCDRVAVLHAGQLVEEGSVADLAAQHAVVRVTLSPDELPHAQEVLTGWQTHVSGPDALLVEQADPRTVNEALGRSGLWAREIRRERATLESRFLHLTSECRSPKEFDDAPAAR